MASMAISCVDFKTSPFLVNLNAGFFSAENNVKHGFLSSGTLISQLLKLSSQYDASVRYTLLKRKDRIDYYPYVADAALYTDQMLPGTSL